MANKKNPPQRRSLNDRITAAIEDNENTQIAGITPENEQNSAQPPVTNGTQEPSPAGNAAQGEPRPAAGQGSEPLRTKKATTIMPKEVFNLLQRYCTETDTPKHRAVYLFILDGLHAAATITDDEYARFRDMAALLTTTYEKK